MSDPCNLLDWDTEFFGKRIARATESRLNDIYIQRVLEWCQEQGIECLYFLADADDPETTRLAEQHGFRLVDIRLTFERVLESWGGERDQDPECPVRLVRPADLDVLRKIAGECYHLTRFYYDDCFPLQASARLYQTWIEKSVQGYADRVFVAELQGRPVGYLTCHLHDGGKSGVIGLVGIEQENRGSGVGNSLVYTALQWFAGHACAHVSVVTQGRNIAAQRLYQRNGFLTKSVQLWYHKWFVGCKS
jgi:dTDP-4-amino-4,6-dideoxy-D-galactose acyltransferase